MGAQTDFFCLNLYPIFVPIGFKVLTPLPKNQVYELMKDVQMTLNSNHFKNYMRLWHIMPSMATMSKKTVLAQRSKSRSMTLMSFERTSLVEYACQI